MAETIVKDTPKKGSAKKVARKKKCTICNAGPFTAMGLAIHKGKPQHRASHIERTETYKDKAITKAPPNLQNLVKKWTDKAFDTVKKDQYDIYMECAFDLKDLLNK